MLTNSVTEISTNLAEVLVDRNLKLVPKAGTLISQLAATTVNSVYVKEFHSKEAIGSVLAAASVGADVGGTEGPTEYQHSEHDTLMDNYISDLGTLTTNYLAFARSGVNPKVTEFKEQMEAALANHCQKEPEEFFNVTYFTPHDIFKGQLVRDEVASLSGKTVNYKQEHINLREVEELEGDDLLNLFLTGHESTDKEITFWIPSLGSKVKQYLLEKVNELTLPLTAQLDYALVNFLFYRNMYENPSVNSGETSTSMKRKAFENREYYGNLLASSLNSHELALKSGKLLGDETNTSFSYISEGPFDVVVYEENFKKAAEQGCGIETIFGYLSSTDSSLGLNVEQLVENKEKYANTWLRTRGLYLVHMNNKKIDIFKHLARNVFDESLKEGNLIEAEVEVHGGNSVFKEKVLEEGHKYIGSLSVEDIDDLDRISLTLVAGIRFQFSNAYELLKGMDDLMRKDEDLDPKEAALYSAIDTLLDFCLEQVEAVRL